MMAAAVPAMADDRHDRDDHRNNCCFNRGFVNDGLFNDGLLNDGFFIFVPLTGFNTGLNTGLCGCLF